MTTIDGNAVAPTGAAGFGLRLDTAAVPSPPTPGTVPTAPDPLEPTEPRAEGATGGMLNEGMRASDVGGMEVADEIPPEAPKEPVGLVEAGLDGARVIHPVGTVDGDGVYRNIGRVSGYPGALPGTGGDGVGDAGTGDCAAFGLVCGEELDDDVCAPAESAQVRLRLQKIRLFM